MWQSGAVTTDTYCRHDDSDEYFQLSDIAEHLEPAAPLPIPSPAPASSKPRITATELAPSPRGSSGSYVPAIVVIAIICIVTIAIRFGGGSGSSSDSGSTTHFFSSSQPSATFRQNLDKFITEGSRLNSLSSQGVNFASFGEQLATTTATFDLLAPSWPPSWPTDERHSAKFEFQLALHGWKILYQLWRRQISDHHDSTNDRATIIVLETYAPGLIKYDDGYTTFIPYRTNVRILMGVASGHFETGRALIQDSSKQ